jgi:hypothetical protein
MPITPLVFSETYILGLAARYLSQAGLAIGTQDSIIGQNSREFLPLAIAMALRRNIWNFSIQRAVLARVTAEEEVDDLSQAPDPVTGAYPKIHNPVLYDYQYVYALPSNYIQVVEVYTGISGISPKPLWLIENNRLYSSISPLSMRYSAYPREYSELAPAFVEIVALDVASRCAYIVLNSINVAKMIDSMRVEKEAEVLAIENTEKDAALIYRAPLTNIYS